MLILWRIFKQTNKSSNLFMIFCTSLSRLRTVWSLIFLAFWSIQRSRFKRSDDSLTCNSHAIISVMQVWKLILFDSTHFQFVTVLHGFDYKNSNVDNNVNINNNKTRQQQQQLPQDKVYFILRATTTTMRKSNSTCLILLISRLCLLSMAFTFSLLLLSAVRISTCVRVSTINKILEQARKFIKTIGYEEINNPGH